MSVLKFIHAADLHLDSEFNALPPKKAAERRNGQRRLLSRLAETATDNGAQAILLCGDIFESDDVSPETRREFCRCFGSLDMPVFVAPGNHDPYFPGCVWDRMELPANVHIFKGAALSCFESPELGAKIWGAGFEKAFCPPLLRFFTPPEKRDGVFDIMLLHGDLEAGRSDYAPLSAAEIEQSGMDYVALGHIHTKSALNRAGSVFYAYPGCAEGRGYDETGEKGCYLITLSTEGARAQFIPLGGVLYEILSVDCTDVNAEAALENALSGIPAGSYCRVILTGEETRALDLNALRRAFEPPLAQLRLRDERVSPLDVWGAIGRDDLAGVFLKKLNALLELAGSDTEREKIELAARYGVLALENGGRAL